MNLSLTSVETERLVAALGVVSSDTVRTHEWEDALATSVGWLMRAPTAVVLETADAVRMSGEAASAALIAWAEHYGGRGAGNPPTGVWSQAESTRSVLGLRRAFVGMTARTAGGGERMSVVCQRTEPASEGEVERCAAMMRLLFPSFEAAVARRHTGKGAALTARVQPDPVEAPAARPPAREVEEAAIALRRRYRLTPRELEVARLLLRGKSNDEVALTLGISGHTARHHTERVFAKLDVRSRAALWPAALERAAAPPLAGAGALPNAPGSGRGGPGDCRPAHRGAARQRGRPGGRR